MHELLIEAFCICLLFCILLDLDFGAQRITEKEQWDWFCPQLYQFHFNIATLISIALLLIYTSRFRKIRPNVQKFHPTAVYNVFQVWYWILGQITWAKPYGGHHTFFSFDPDWLILAYAIREVSQLSWSHFHLVSHSEAALKLQSLIQLGREFFLPASMFFWIVGQLLCRPGHMAGTERKHWRSVSAQVN